MKPIYFRVGNSLSLMVLPDSQAHLDGHTVLTYTYGILKVEMQMKMVYSKKRAPDALVKSEKPEILINSISGDTIELRILIWISSVYVEPSFKNQLFRSLISRFNTEQIKLM